MRRMPLITALFVAATLAVSAGPAMASTTKPVLRVADATAPTNLNPAIDISSGLAALAYEPIIHQNDEGHFVPGLATKWGYVGNAKTFEFTLRHDARFSDGTSVTAQAVKQWMIYFSKAGGSFQHNIPFKTIQTVGKWKVILHLVTGTPNMEFILAEPYMSGFVGSPASLKHPDDLKTNTYGAGPYMLDKSETVAGDHYTYIPNPDYYDKSAVHYSKITYTTITQPSSMLAALESGQIDVGAGDLSTVKSAESDSNLNVTSSVGGWVGLLLLNRGATTNTGAANPLSKLEVRQALNYAVDRKAITQAFFGSQGEVTDEAPTLDGWSASAADEYSYNPTKAKKMLAAAGYPNGFSLDVLSETFFGTLGDPYLQAVAKYLSAVGVTLNITEGPTLNGWLPKYEGDDFQATGFVEGPVISAFTTYNNWYGPKSYVQHHGWDDPVLDKLDHEGENSKNAPHYAQLMMQRITNQADELIVSTARDYTYANKDVGGIGTSDEGGPYPTDWYPVKTK
jgi:peptide/nickel transport system substrate-binding protein